MVGIMLPSTTLTFAAARWGHQNRELRAVRAFKQGMAPIVIGIFLLFSLLFIFIGLLGEYIGSIHSYVKNRPIVVEKERINF
jgi:hypothetical protein